MECLVVIERKSNSRHYGSGVAQLDRAQNSNSKVALVQCPLSLLCTWGEKNNVIKPINGGAAQRIRA